MRTILSINNQSVLCWASGLDKETKMQAGNICALPFLYHHFALMADAHAGMGMPIGGVLATLGVVVPNAVGVDIGCGMSATRTNLKVKELNRGALVKLADRIRQRIPLGFAGHKVAQDECLMPDVEIERLHVVKRQYDAARLQLGTLGGGNHFIELQQDEKGFLWIMLHTGSRNLGKQVGEYYNKKAQWMNEAYYSCVSKKLQMAFLPEKTQEFDDYWSEMKYCIEYALCNRRLIMARIQEVIAASYPNVCFAPTIDIAHNYAARERHYGREVIVHRKGATLARKGAIGIIPGSQGTCSYIVEGLGNPESFYSSSHGAGRLMSRIEAKRNLSLEDEINRMNAMNIVHNMQNINDLEEAAGAYKDIEDVMKNQTDLVKIITRLQPVAVIKG